MTKGSDNPYPSELFVEQSSTPTSPSSGNQRLFIRTSDHLLCYVNSSGTVTTVGGGLTDPMTTRGDIIVRNASNVTARLGVGAAGKFISSDGTDTAWGQGPLTTTGDLLLGATGGTPTRLAVGSAGALLTSSGTTAQWNKTITGIVNSDGTIAAGSGFTVNHTGTGGYTVTFSVSFSAAPVVIVQGFAAAASRPTFLYSVPSTSTFDVLITNFGGSNTDAAFNFIAHTVS